MTRSDNMADRTEEWSGRTAAVPACNQDDAAASAARNQTDEVVAERNQKIDEASATSNEVDEAQKQRGSGQAPQMRKAAQAAVRRRDSAQAAAQQPHEASNDAQKPPSTGDAYRAYRKRQLLESKQYTTLQKDALRTLLRDQERYTHEQVQTILDQFHRKVVL